MVENRHLAFSLSLFVFVAWNIPYISKMGMTTHVSIKNSFRDQVYGVH